MLGLSPGGFVRFAGGGRGGGGGLGRLEECVSECTCIKGVDRRLDQVDHRALGS